MWAAFTRAETEFAELLWAECSVSRELDAELFRWTAIRNAVAEAGRLGLTPQSVDSIWPRDRLPTHTASEIGAICRTPPARRPIRGQCSVNIVTG